MSSMSSTGPVPVKIKRLSVTAISAARAGVIVADDRITATLPIASAVRTTAVTKPTSLRACEIPYAAEVDRSRGFDTVPRQALKHRGPATTPRHNPPFLPTAKLYGVG